MSSLPDFPSDGRLLCQSHPVDIRNVLMPENIKTGFVQLPDGFLTISLCVDDGLTLLLPPDAALSIGQALIAIAARYSMVAESLENQKAEPKP